MPYLGRYCNRLGTRGAEGLAKAAKTIAVETYKHDETRKNIPTEELREFEPDTDELKTLLWPRNPDLDPQLVWKGKDEQDRAGLEVPVVPIYIQEKPAAGRHRGPAGGLQGRRASPALPVQRGLQRPALRPARGLLPARMGWTNRMVLRDSLLVMTSLAEKEGLRGKVQTIYMDPPYGFNFGSNWQASTAKRDGKDGAAADVTQKPEITRAFKHVPTPPGGSLERGPGGITNKRGLLVMARTRAWPLGLCVPGRVTDILPHSGVKTAPIEFGRTAARRATVE
jgi:hypothetical protein